MEQKDIKAVYFVGIGGIGMSAIARYFLRMGLVVAGYDKTPSPLTRQMPKRIFAFQSILSPVLNCLIVSEIA